MNKINESYKNVAFISYSHKNMTVARWLQRRLEGFKLPIETHNDIDANSRYLRPVFRDQSDLNTGILGDELRKHLEESKYLIVICSKYSAKSKWVSEETKAFVDMGRLDRIIPVIIPEANTSELELFPKYLREYFSKNPNRELLGVNIGELGKEKSLIRVVSRMIDVSFDSLWQRHQRQRRIRIITYTSLSGILLAGAYLFTFPANISVSANLQKANLPKGETVTLLVNDAEFKTSIENPHFKSIRLPGYYRFKGVGIKIYSEFYSPIDTIVNLGVGLSRKIEINMRRDNSFGVYAGEIFDEDLNPIENVKVSILNYSVITDTDGKFSITIPIGEQHEELPIVVRKTDYEYNYNGNAHTPGKNIKLIMHHNKNTK